MDVLGPEDLNDIAEIIAHRTGRQLAELQANPGFHHIHTVHDLVEYFANQRQVANG